MKQAHSKLSKNWKRNDEAQALRDLFVEELKEIFWTEKALTKTLPNLLKYTNSVDLTEIVSAQLELCNEHVTRLQEVFRMVGVRALALRCETTEKLISETNEMISGLNKGKVLDAALILNLQKTWHYQMASYGTLSAFAKVLEENDASELLEETLYEEKDCEESLVALALKINVESFLGDEEFEYAEPFVTAKVKTKDQTLRTK